MVKYRDMFEFFLIIIPITVMYVIYYLIKEKVSDFQKKNEDWIYMIVWIGLAFVLGMIAMFLMYRPILFSCVEELMDALRYINFLEG